MRFRTKTILGVAVIEMVLLAVLVGSTLAILRESNEAELVRRVQLGGKLLAAAAKDAVLAQDLATLDSLVNEAMGSGQIDSVRILDAGGTVLAQRGETSLLGRASHQDRTIAEVTDGIFDWSSPIEAGGIRHGEVRLAVSIEPLAILLGTARRWAAGIAGIEMLLVALFSWLLGSYLARQLVALRQASVIFGGGDFAHRVPVRGDDELAQTAAAFNHMAAQLGDSHQALSTENRMRLDTQQELEAALSRIRDRTEQLNAIFALSPDGFVSFDAGQRVKYASPAFFRMTGLAEDRILGAGEAEFSDRLARSCIDTARFPGVAALRATQTVGAGATAPPQAGTRRQLIELAGPGRRVLEVDLRLSDAESVSQILYFRDVTHETEVDRMKSEFLSTAAHELRTPMASIYGFSEIMIANDYSAEERQEFLGAIHRQSQLMISIINELLDLVRIEARRGKDFVFAPVDPDQLLDELVADFKAPDGRPGPQRTAMATPCRLRADRKKLMQAVANVLSNAYKYSSPGTPVHLEVVTRPAAAGSPALIGIRITDRGVGMTPEQLARVCERFYRADASGKVPGTGLGMSIVKEIVELHGGTVELASTVGAGSTVTLWIPAAKEETPS